MDELHLDDDLAAGSVLAEEIEDGDGLADKVWGLYGGELREGGDGRDLVSGEDVIDEGQQDMIIALCGKDMLEENIIFNI